MSSALLSEVDGSNLGDVRLDRRLGKLVETLGKYPSHSIPAATNKRADMEAAYRFFGNSKVTPESILQPHTRATLDRVRQSKMVLLVQDTTELDLTRPSEQVDGVGLMDSQSRFGAFYHPMVAFNSEGLALGTVWQKSWKREKLESDLSASERGRLRYLKPIEAKESYRWIEGLREARKVAQNCPDTTCVCVADSEADIYEVFSEPREFGSSSGSVDETEPCGQVHVLVRAKQGRSTLEQGDWLEAVRETPLRYTDDVAVSKRAEPKIAPKLARKRQKPRDARFARVEVRAMSTTLRAPCRYQQKLAPVAINLVLIEEAKSPDGSEPVSWLLATSLPIGTQKQIREVVNAYRQRWQIEVFFRTLKSGCRIESRQFEKMTRVLNSVALYSIIAWRVMYLSRLGRECPNLCCEVIFDPSEWQAVYAVVKGKKPPKKPPKLNEVVKMIASLGGYIQRNNTEPGTQTLWIGLQRIFDLSNAWTTFGPTSKIFSRTKCVER